MGYSAIKGALNGVVPEVEGRIYLLFAPQGAKLPFVVMQRISQVPSEQTFDGPTDLEPGRYQVAYWTDDAKKLPAAEKAMRTALRGLGFIEGLSDDAEPPASGEARTYVLRFEVEIVAEAQEA